MNDQISRTRAFTAMELLATVGMVGILGALSLTVIVGVDDGAKRMKLRSNVETLNQAIDVYQSNGGQLPAGTDAHQVISKLKTVGDNVVQRTFPGFRGSFVDGRMIAVNVAAGESGPRAVWDPTERKFDLADSGEGVRFELQDVETADFALEESRQTDTPGFAKASSWVWDFNETPPAAARVVPGVAVNDIDPVNVPSYQTPIQLAPPIFSLPGGIYPIGDFPIFLTLSNPPINPLGTPIKYSVDSMPWQIYNGTPLTVSADSHIVAYADSNGDSHYFSSFATTHFYGQEEAELAFAGQSSGDFRDAGGGEAMVVNYVNNGLDAEFEWGQGVSGFATGSMLSFTSDSFLDVAAESWFRLGGLNYFNSTISMPTQATNVWLDISIDFETPDIMETFAFELALENTLNQSSNTADQNADYVRITNPNSAFSTSLNGIDYELQLQFGYLGSAGFATVDEFHVHEGASATADIWGYFVRVEEEEEEDDDDDQGEDEQD